MKLYDNTIEKIYDLINKTSIDSLELQSSWKNLNDKIFIFPEDSKVELGATNCKSTYIISYTSSEQLVSKDEILLIGKDIKDLKGDSPFARITLINIDDSEIKRDQESYRILRDIEYKRYKVNPEGYMIRVNTNQIREGARISQLALDKNISFKDIGNIFMNAYKQNKNVKYVKQIFITDPNFDYDSLMKIANVNEGITVTLDHIMKKLKMDCNTCSYKDICDEIEGMRDIHKREEYKM